MRAREEAIYSPAVAKAETPLDASFAHLSIEVGHFEPESLRRGRDHFANRLSPITPWLAPVRTALVGHEPEPSTSTCFLIDDYTEPIKPPSKVIPQLLEAARECHITIDYLVRESALAEPAGSSAADFARKLMKPDLLRTCPGDLSSPTASEWLSDGARQPTPPSASDAEEIASSKSNLLETELWREDASGKQWSCSFLAGVWQLARLGLLDDMSRSYLTPQKWEESLAIPRWDELSPVIQLNHHAAPFQAYRTVSVLGAHYLPVEAAVRAILKQVDIKAVLDRINYVFIDM
jgi:hypothetical protein